MSDRIITFEYAFGTLDAYKKQAIPNIKECMTKDDVINYINVDTSLLSGYVNNRLVPRSKVVGLNPVDLCFDFNNVVYDIKIQTDGKILVGGLFTTYKGTPVKQIVRLNTDASLDTTFNTGTGFTSGGGYNTTVNSIAIQNDGKILVGGRFTSYNGTTRYSILRLNSDGTIDTSFDAGTLVTWINTSTAPGLITDILLTNNSIYISGEGDYFTYAKLSLNGVKDTNFINYPVHCLGIAITKDNSGYVYIVIYNAGSATNTYGVVKLHQNTGTITGNFNLNYCYFNGYINDIEFHSSTNTILVGGQFTSYKGTTCRYLTRLNSNADIDTTFNNNVLASSLNKYVQTVKVQDDGKILTGTATFNNL